MNQYHFYSHGVPIKRHDTLGSALRHARQFKVSFPHSFCHIIECEMIYLLGTNETVFEPTGRTITLVRTGTQSVDVAEDLDCNEEIAEEVSDEDLIFDADEMSEEDILSQL